MSKQPTPRRRKTSVGEPRASSPTQQGQTDRRYDEDLLDLARTQWRLGDWLSLAALEPENLQNHPDRAELVLLAAAGLLQSNRVDVAVQFIHQARNWGCASDFIVRILAAGVHNSLGRAASCMGDFARAYRNFESAILLGQQDNNVPLVAEARAAYQRKLLGLEASSSSTTMTGSASRAGSTQSETYLVKVKLRLGSFVSVDLGFNTVRTSWLSIRQDAIDYRTESGSPQYLVSNESGDFERPPQQVQIPIEADASYLLSGEIAHNGDNNPVVWIFQYADGRKINAQSIPTVRGRIRHGFRTLPTAESIAIGIRLAGSGRLNLQGTALSLRERADEDLISQIDKKIEKIEQSQKRNVENSMKQIEVCIRLQHYLGPDIILPDTHNWPISPDFGVLLINLVEQHGYQGIIEFGSGTSTLILAKAQERVAHREGKLPPPLLSFDHLKEYRDKTQGLINQAGLTAHTNIVLAPLVEWLDARGDQYAYYACDEALQAFQKQLPHEECRLLVIVDGPPAATCRHARYPALPKVLETLGKNHRIDFLLDDYLRSEEQEVAARWLEILAAMDLPHARTEFNSLEKKACLIEVRPAKNRDNP
jgi:tetratricopeptide (TPR) repeat protein